MTEKIYYSHPEKNHIKAEIISLKKGKKYAEVILNATVFYPEGGGQPADSGCIADCPVYDVQIKDDKIIHYTDKKILTAYKEGDCVNLLLNRERRNDHTVQHSAQHLLSAVLFDKYKTQTLSFHLGKEYSTIDIESEFFRSEFLPDAEDLCWEAVAKNIPVTAEIFADLSGIKNKKLRKKPKVNKDIRIVEIAGYDASPCGGTHVISTGEIGIIKILKLENYKGNYRLFFVAGKRSFSDYRAKSEIVNALSTLYSCGQEGILNKIEKENNKNSIIKKNLNGMRTEIAEIFAQTINSSEDEKFILKLDKNFHDNDLIKEIKKLIGDGKIVFFILESLLRVSVYSSNDNFSVKEFYVENLKSFAGKGGGNKQAGDAVWQNKKDFDKFIDFIQKYPR